ncbi:MAG: hypothetical protein AAFX53_02425 [Bacteroidota bacterium]
MLPHLNSTKNSEKGQLYRVLGRLAIAVENGKMNILAIAYGNILKVMPKRIQFPGRIIIHDHHLTGEIPRSRKRIGSISLFAFFF